MGPSWRSHCPLGACRVTDWPGEILTVRLGLVPLSIPPRPVGPSLLPPLELCPNASTFLLAPALLSILGLQGGGEALGVAEAGVVSVSRPGSLCPAGCWAQLLSL